MDKSKKIIDLQRIKNELELENAYRSMLGLSKITIKELTKER